MAGKAMEERTISSERIYRGRVVSLRVDVVQLPDGRVTRREIVEHRGAVAMVATDDEGRVLLVRQYRKAVEGVLLEIPAGTLEPGEDPDECVRRELEEETGYRAERVEHLGGFFSAPGFCTEYLYLYRCSDLHPVASHADEDEQIELVRVPLDEVPRLIEAGEIRDAKSVAGLLRVLAREQ